MPSFAKFGNDLYSGRRSIDFVGRRRIWYAIAVTAVLLSLLALGIRGLNLGIEFKGGSEFDVTKSSIRSQTAGVDAVHTIVPGAEVHVSTLGSTGMRVQTNKLTDAQLDTVQRAVATSYRVPLEEVSTSFVGPTWGQDVSNKALTGLLVFLVAVALVISLYFRTWKMALAAIIALIHDLLLTVGVYAALGFEVTPASVIGFLTILGYSLYDTVVVFDKVRENTDHIAVSSRRTFSEAANLAVNQTLVRSINTSVVALLPVGSILFIGALLLGAGTLKDISLALFVGIAAGTYSSIFIATPILAHLRQGEPEMRAQAERVRRRRAEAGDLPAGLVGGSGGGTDEFAVGADQLAAVGAGSGAPVGAGSGAPEGAGPGPGGTVGPGAGSTGGQGGQRQQPRRGQSRQRPGSRKR
jgi:preprotein translocase subunit SecF